MTKAKINGVRLKISEREPLFAGTADTNRIELSFSEEWAGLLKQIDFTNKTSGESRRISAQAEVCTVPWEVLKVEGDVSCCVRGIGADGKLKMRTNEENLGTVLGSAQDDVPGSTSPTPEVCDELAAKIGEPTELETSEKSNLVAAVNEVKHTADGKQDKLIAGENITIAEDGKTISATGGGASNAIGYFEVTLTERDDGLYTGSKTFAQVKSEIESNNCFMLIDGYDGVFILTRIGNVTLEFAGMLDGTDGWMRVEVSSDERWEVIPEVRITLDWYNGLVNDIGKLRNLTTTDKTSLVAAVNEVKGIADSKQAKLIAGENITIAADGRTISATGGDLGNVKVPTKTSELENDSGFVAASELAAELADKQDIITDLATIRSGAAKGATALQSIPSSYRTATAQDAIDNALSDKLTAIEGKENGWDAKYNKPTGGIPKSDLASAVQTSLGKADTALQSVPSTYRTANAQDAIDNTKVTKVTGKSLSTNDYTDAAKAKVDAIPANPKYTDTVYDDTAVKSRISAVEGKLNGNGSVSFASVTADSLTTKSQVEIYGDQPHIDFHSGNSVDDYTSRIIETVSGKLNFAAPNGVQINGTTIDLGKLGIESITLSVASSRLSDLSYTAKYSPLLNAVFVRIYGKIAADLNTGYDYDVLNIGSRLPEANAALAVKCNKNCMVFAKSTGTISLRPLEIGIKGYDIYIAGFWFV